MVEGARRATGTVPSPGGPRNTRKMTTAGEGGGPCKCAEERLTVRPATLFHAAFRDMEIKMARDRNRDREFYEALREKRPERPTLSPEAYLAYLNAEQAIAAEGAGTSLSADLE